MKFVKEELGDGKVGVGMTEVDEHDEAVEVEGEEDEELLVV